LAPPRCTTDAHAHAHGHGHGHGHGHAHARAHTHTHRQHTRLGSSSTTRDYKYCILFIRGFVSNNMLSPYLALPLRSGYRSLISPTRLEPARIKKMPRSVVRDISLELRRFRQLISPTRLEPARFRLSGECVLNVIVWGVGVEHVASTPSPCLLLKTRSTSDSSRCQPEQP